MTNTNVHTVEIPNHGSGSYQFTDLELATVMAQYADKTVAQMACEYIDRTEVVPSMLVTRFDMLVMLADISPIDRP